MSVAVRPMAAGDVAAVAALEATAFSSPWLPETFHKLLDRPGAVLTVMTDGDGLVGYSVLWCVVDQGEIANIAIAEERRGEGLGRRLLEDTLERAAAAGVRSLFLEVRASNGAARALYASRGFREIGVRRDYYDAPREDALVLKLELEPDSDDA